MNLFEQFARRAWSTVVFCDGLPNAASCTEVIGYGSIGVANGIALRRRQLYVVASRDRSLHIYDRTSKEDPTSLHLRAIVPTMNSGCDNIDVDEESGEMYLGCHPNALAVLGHFRNKSVAAPTQVLRVTPPTTTTTTAKGNENYLVEELLYSHGEDLSGSSVAVVHKKEKMFVGGVFDEGVLMCPYHK